MNVAVSVIDPNNLPDDVDALKRMIVSLAGDRARYRLEIEKLESELSKLRRNRFGQSSEQRDAREEQLELEIETLTERVAEADARLPAAIINLIENKLDAQRPARRALPETLPLVEDRQPEPTDCSACGGPVRKVSEKSSEVLDYVPGYFRRKHVIRGVFACKACDTIFQPPAPDLPITRGRATPALLTHVVVSKFDDHIPLFRQADIALRQGVDLASSTMSGWVGGAAVAIEPLVDALAKDLMTSAYLHADDTPIDVLAPGNGKTKTAYFWVYARDERIFGGDRPPAVLFHYAINKTAAQPLEHLKTFSGVLHVDGYTGFNRVFETGRVRPQACWAHSRRDFIDWDERCGKDGGSPIAKEAIERIGQLYGVEREINGLSPDDRRRIRQVKSLPIAEDLKRWSEAKLTQIAGSTDLAKAFRHLLGRWSAFTAFLDDGHIAIDNNVVERAIRGSAIGKKNFLFMGSNRGGERAALFYSLIETCRLNHVNPEAYLTDVFSRINDHPARAIADLLPWNWKPAKH
jgi:transposase